VRGPTASGAPARRPCRRRDGRDGRITPRPRPALHRWLLALRVRVSDESVDGPAGEEDPPADPEPLQLLVVALERVRAAAEQAGGLGYGVGPDPSGRMRRGPPVRAAIAGWILGDGAYHLGVPVGGQNSAHLAQPVAQSASGAADEVRHHGTTVEHAAPRARRSRVWTVSDPKRRSVSYDPRDASTLRRARCGTPWPQRTPCTAPQPAHAIGRGGVLPSPTPHEERHPIRHGAMMAHGADR
jgi:hypothetical protein